MASFSRWGRVLRALLLAAAVAASPVLAAPLVLDEDAQPVPLGSSAQAWLDAGGQATVDEVAAARGLRWRASGPNEVQRIAPGQALWMRFQVPATETSEHWYLEIPDPGLDQVTLYAPDAAGRWSARQAGDHIAVARWPLPHRHPVLPLALAADQPRTHYVRIQNGGAFDAPLQLVSDDFLMRTEQQVSLVLGIYFGLVGLAILLSAWAAVTLRERVYTLYLASALLMALTQAAITGVAGLHLWGGWPWWNDLAPQVLPLFALASLQLFLAEIVSLRERSRGCFRLLLAGTLAALPVAAGVIGSPDAAQRELVTLAYVVTGALATLGAVAWSALRGDRYAPWLLAGFLPVLLAAVFPLARAAGLIPASAWTTYGMELAVAAQLPILLVVMLVRSQDRREHLRRIQGLDRIDPVTGLINAAVFHERLVRLIARSRRLKMRSALLLVDLGNMEQIRRDFGADSARELALRVAGRLLSVAREIDTVARLSEHRFGVLLEGPLHTDEVAEAAPRIVARCLLPFKGRPLEWSAQVRVAQALLPMDGSDPALLVGRLETLLAAAPVDSRRSVFMLSRAGALTASVH
jgi:GGDEF domain-containing protein